MIEFRRLTHEDYEDICDISKDIWGGTDYLPKVFHKWVEDEGYFLGVIDSTKNKVIGVGKLSILQDKSGWLEGLRVHTEYRGLKLGRKISETLLNIAKDYLKAGKVKKIAFATHLDNVESISLMKKLNFKLREKLYVFYKDYEYLDPKLTMDDFKVEPWNLSYEEFRKLSYINKRNGYLDLAFIFQEPTIELYNDLKTSGAFISINGFNGIFKLKGEPNFSAVDETYEAINTFMNYFLLKYKGSSYPYPVSTITVADESIVKKLKSENYGSWSNWQIDYLYYVFE
jgi:ribosomal protein S18 acetylase RimI-like enzyme